MTPQRSIAVASNAPFKGQLWDRLAQAAHPNPLQLFDWDNDESVAAALEQAEIAILASDLDERFLDASRLKWVHCDHAGLTRSARPEIFESGLIVTGSAGRSAPALAEHAMMFSLLLSSGYPMFYEAQKRHEWLRSDAMDSLRALSGRTMGIIGMGHTGTELALRAKAFGMKVIGYRRKDMENPEGVDQMLSAQKGQSIDPLLAQSDIVVLVINLSDATRHLIDTRAFSLMKSSAYLVNMARGGVVDTAALLTAIRQGQIAGAGLDVTDPEPLPNDHPLWDAPNVLITPHFTAPLPDRAARSLDIVIENLSRYRAGRPMLNQITREDLWSFGDPNPDLADA